MVGFGAGARSYTRALHYSTPWKMVARNIRGVVEDYCRRMQEGDTRVYHGIMLDAGERQRRHAILSLLYEGLDGDEFTRTFGFDVRATFAEQWEALEAEECVVWEGSRVCLTPRGVRHADVVGQLFYSPDVLQLIEEFEYDR
jgi:oxygen-independent coproporphyrinogen-3 oxidase